MTGNRTRNHTSTDQFRVVCIGASAGGLEALISLLKFIPKNIPMAFVIIQHLEPLHKSALPEILSRETSLFIREAKNKIKIEASQCYVIPPNTLMAVSHGYLKITSREKRQDGKYLPIDFFMTSLSEELGKNSVGVVLSGTGSDGTEGVKAIKSKGGNTFAQDEKTARYFGMPECAIASGAVDAVLEPKKIAERLVRMCKPGFKIPIKRVVHPSSLEKDFMMILELLRDYTGVDFLHYKKTTMSRRIARRMAYRKLESHADYYRYLRKDPDEAEALLKDILIPVTHFFRDPEVFTAIRDIVFPAIMKKRSKTNPIRIWVPACSSGEEVYSLAMLLSEFLEEKRSRYGIQIFGTDISELTIAKARVGTYAEGISELVSGNRLRRFFTKTEKGYKIARFIRDLCVFAKHDVTCDPPLSNMDIVSCRNMLIYLECELQSKALSMLHYAVKPEGFLIIGNSESVSALPDHFKVIDKKNKLFSRNNVSRRIAADIKAPAIGSKMRPASGRLSGRAKIKLKKPVTPSISYPNNPESGKRRTQKGNTTGTNRMRSEGTEVERLKREFAHTVEKMKSISEEKDTFNEELKAANEEIQSGNEELQSMNEELETAKEELQSTNEELLTLNDELLSKNAELMELNSDLGNVFASTNIPMIIVGSDLRIKRFTPSARKVMNLIPSDINRPIGDIKLNIDIANLEDVIRPVIEDITPAESEVRDREGRWYSVRIRPYRTTDNRIDGAIISMVDIDAIKCSREEIQASLNYNRAIIETMREPLVVLDSNARVLSANKSFCKSFKLKETDVRDELFYEIGGRQWDKPEIRKLINEILPMNTRFNDIEITIDVPGGGCKIMLVNGRCIDSHNGDKPMTLLVMEDITLRKKAEDLIKRDNEELEKTVVERSRELFEIQVKLERAKHLANIGTLAATVAHELRNTLTAIKMSSYNIRRKINDPCIDGNLSNITNKITDGIQIINNVLSYSKIKISHFTPVKINDILESCIGEVKDRDSMHKASIRENIAPTKDIFIDADGPQLKEVFLNILYNSIDAINMKSGSIEIDTGIDGTSVAITIKDNGEGIKEENIEKVADPFFTTKAKGTGLGLSVCTQVLLLHDGSMKIESEPDKGTAIKVLLPIQRKKISGS